MSRPGTEDWMDALKRVALLDSKRAWLRAHLAAPGCTATAEALEAATGAPIGDYRALAAELAVALDRDLPVEPLALLAVPAGQGWTLRPELAFALGAHRVLPEAWTRGGKEAAPLQPAPGESPIVVLVRPQLAENIGTTARAMANGGLFHLRLVAPRDGWPQDRGRLALLGFNTVAEQLVGDAVVKRIERRIYDVARDANARPAHAGIVEALDHDAGYRRRAAARIEDAHLVVHQCHAGEAGIMRHQRLA